MDPRAWTTLQMEATRLQQQGDVEKAAHLLIEAIELAPKEPKLYEQLIPLTLRMGSTQTAVDAAKELLRVRPGPASEWLAAVAALAHGDTGDAKRRATQLSKSDDASIRAQAKTMLAQLK